jgi:glucose-6-phosphate isomerase
MKENIILNLKNLEGFVSFEEIAALAQLSLMHLDSLNKGTGAGNEMLGWLSYPDIASEQFEKIEKAAKHLRSISDTTVVIGIGGSYLGSKAVIDGLSHSFASILKKEHHEILFAGQNIDEDYMAELIEVLDERNYSIVVISKSGVTTEPAIAFRIIKDHLEKKVGKARAAERIIAITSYHKGNLRNVADKNNYEKFEIPDNIGGRYSVLTPVGLLPIAIAGFDIRELVAGAKSMKQLTNENRNASSNIALLYAAARNLLLRSGKTTEILVGFNPRLHYFFEWWKQLFGESEGKELKGIFPASVDFTTDLHSLGQYIQDGQRMLFETFVSVSRSKHEILIKHEDDNSDELNYLEGQRLAGINYKAELGTTLAHYDGKVPVMTIKVPELNAFYLGQLIYFFEIACGVSGYILGVNPFNQPGVEGYKQNMFALLNKPDAKIDYTAKGRLLWERLKEIGY